MTPIKCHQYIIKYRFMLRYPVNFTIKLYNEWNVTHFYKKIMINKCLDNIELYLKYLHMNKVTGVVIKFKDKI